MRTGLFRGGPAVRLAAATRRRALPSRRGESPQIAHASGVGVGGREGQARAAVRATHLGEGAKQEGGSVLGLPHSTLAPFGSVRIL